MRYRDGIKLEKRMKPSNPGYDKPVRTTEGVIHFTDRSPKHLNAIYLPTAVAKTETEPNNADSSKRCSYIMTDDEVKSQGMTYLEEKKIVLIRGTMYRLVHKRYNRFYSCK